MSRGLDHVVHAVRDVEAAGELYRRLGFTVGSRNRHSWGTHNRLIQLPGFFIELLTVAEPELLGEDSLSRLFGRFNQSFLARREGLSLLILESASAAADAAAFKAAGISACDALRFEREGKRPDGATIKVGFSLAFARDQRAPEIGFATCQQHFPENFWNPAFQQHANGVCGIAAAVLVADNPSDHHEFLSAFTGQRELSAGSGYVTATTPRGEVRILDPTAFGDRFGSAPPDVTAGARLGALVFRVRDRAALTAALAAGAVPFVTRQSAVVVPQAMGATLVFEPDRP